MSRERLNVATIAAQLARIFDDCEQELMQTAQQAIARAAALAPHDDERIKAQIEIAAVLRLEAFRAIYVATALRTPVKLGPTRPAMEALIALEIDARRRANFCGASTEGEPKH